MFPKPKYPQKKFKDSFGAAGLTSELSPVFQFFCSAQACTVCVTKTGVDAKSRKSHSIVRFAAQTSVGDKIVLIRAL